jgi:hypothetical protein
MPRRSPFAEVPINTSEIPQQALDLANRTRTNPFPWRGQFSPGLVELLLKTYARRESRVLDPFAGIGTTLVGAARNNLASIGTEINPAAVTMAGSVVFIPSRLDERRATIEQVRSLLKENCSVNQPLWSGPEQQSGSPVAKLVSLLECDQTSELESSLLQNTLIRLFEIDGEHTWEDVFHCYRQHCEIIFSLPHSTVECRIENADARALPVGDSSVDLILTSPPYVNVFNYHQNNRQAMELLGWDLLEVAKSEFGSNRKNRGNRFLTVVQYCIDMFTALLEMKRVLKTDGRAMIVVGRESAVRGIAFKNGLIVGTLAAASGFRIRMRQERKFKNKFGGIIFEDILHIEPSADRASAGTGAATDIAREAFEIALGSVTESDVREDLRNAIEGADQVLPSPLYKAPRACARRVA